MWIPMGFNDEMQAVGAVSEQSFRETKYITDKKRSPRDEKNDAQGSSGSVNDVLVERWGEEWVVIAVYYAQGSPDAKPYLRNRRVKGFLYKEQAQQYRDQLINSLGLARDMVPCDMQP